MKWLPWLIFAVFGFFLVGNNFSAKLGMIDDHEIAMFLGGDGKINLTEIPEVIMSTEIGQWGSYLRYRPSYYTLRVIESALWRDNASLWYVSRYLMLVVSLWLGWKIVSTYFPKIVSYLFVFYILTMPFWPDLLTRLGPSEIYAIPASLLFVYGLIKNKLWMVSLGYAVCVGAKENFLILFPILIGWAGYKVYSKKLTRRELIATIVLTLYTLFIAGAILVATSRAGIDIYGTKISYRYRITKLLWDIPKITQNRNLFLAAILMVVAGIFSAWYCFKQGYKKMIHGSIFRHVVLILVLVIVIASQYIFYINLLPSNMRYDFPALLLFPIIDLIALRTIVVFFAKHKYGKVIKISIYAAIVVCCSFYVFHNGYRMIQAQSEKNAVNTQKFETGLLRSKRLIGKNREVTIIFVSKSYADFEPIVSVERFLTAGGVTNEFRLYYNPAKTTSDPMELDDRLKQVMKGNLGTDHIFDRFSAYKLDDKPCYSITFGEALPLPQCSAIAQF